MMDGDTGAQASEPTAPAGWYADPTMVGTQRYWDGSSWSDHVAPGIPQPVAAAAAVPAAADGPSDGVIVAGWITAVVLPIVGFIIGCVLLSKRPGHGVPIMVLAVLATLFWYDALTPDDPFSTGY